MAGRKWLGRCLTVLCDPCHQRAFQWAVDEGYISASPIKSLKRVKGKCRETIISPKQWERLVEASDECFRDFLTFVREAGARPQEARLAEAKHVDLENGRIHWPAGQAPKGKASRTIYLTPVALELVKHLMREHPTGTLLRNSRGEPWSKNAVCCRFRRLREKTGLEDVVCYSTRHTFATESLVKGLDSLVIAELMGHSDKTQLAETYSHLRAASEVLARGRSEGSGLEVS